MGSFFYTFVIMNTMLPKIVFMGTPEIAVYCLEAILQAGYPVVGIVTTPDKPAGRGQKMHYSPLKEYALHQNIPILQPESLKEETFIQTLKSWDPDIQAVVAFRILPEIVWRIPKLGTFNLHTSYLPQYRGAAPIQWAIINGETETGVTTFLIDNHVDTGNILLQEKIPIASDMTAGELYSIMTKKGSNLVIQTIEGLWKDTLKPIPQPVLPEIKLAPKLTRENTQIDWNKSVKEIYNLVRGLNPYPCAWTMLNDKYYKIHDVEPFVCSHTYPIGHIQTDYKNYVYVYANDGYVSITELQKEGKKKMQIQEFLRGNTI